jgi:hypothetical protein
MLELRADSQAAAQPTAIKPAPKPAAPKVAQFPDRKTGMLKNISIREGVVHTPRRAPKPAAPKVAQFPAQFPAHFQN